MFKAIYVRRGLEEEPARKRVRPPRESGRSASDDRGRAKTSWSGRSEWDGTRQDRGGEAIADGSRPKCREPSGLRHRSWRNLAVKRRPSVLWAPAVAAALALTAQVTLARADSLPTYRLTSSVDLPAASTSSTDPQVIINVTPPGAISPVQTGVDTSGNTIYAQPLQPLASSTGINSDLGNVAIFLKPPPGTPGTGTQQLGLSFFGSGLKSLSNGGELDFTLSVDKALGTPVLTPTDPKIHIAQLDLASTTGSTTSSTVTSTTTSNKGTTATTTPGTSTQSIPEPISVVLWAAVAGVLAIRAHTYRRRQSA